MSSTQTVLPISTTSFLDGVGADTHMAYTDGAYANVTQVIADLKYLGITHVRDGITDGLDGNGNPNGSATIATYIAMAQAGIKFTFIIEPTSTTAIQTVLALVNQVEAAVPGSVTAIEGANEINNDPLTFNGVGGEAGALAAQQALYAAVKADATLAGVPVDYFTGYTPGSTDPTTTPGLSDFDNQHPYAQFDEAPAFWVSRAQALTNLTSSDVATAPAVYTETGYSSNAVPTDVQEKYTLDLLMDTAKDGISETYLYQVLDAYAPGSVQGDDGFGLFDYTGTAKPVATAIHNLTTLLQDDGTAAATFKPANLTYTLSGLPSTGNSMVMEKSDGTYVLVVWAEPALFNNQTGVESTAPSENVTVTLPQSFGSIQVYDPTLGTYAIASAANAKTITVALTDHPIVIELSGVAAVTTPVAPPVLTIAAPVQIANTTEVQLSGTVADATATSVQIKDGGAVLGAATVSNGVWSYTSANLAAGSHSFSAVATDAAGNVTTASDGAFTIAASASGLKIVYNSGIDSSATTRTVSSTTPIVINTAGTDTITLAIAEDAYLGDAQFTVSVDGVQIGGVQTATALHAAGLSQNFTLHGNFGAGTHTVTVDFLNDASAIYSNNTLAGDRNLYVDAITGDGVTKVFNINQNLPGSTDYKITLPTVTATAGNPTVTFASQVLTQDTGASVTDDVTSNGAVKLTGTVTGATGTVVTIVDGTTVLGTAKIASGTWTYSTTLSAGTHTLHAVATDPSGNTTMSEAEPSITVDKTAPVVKIATPVLVANTTEVKLSGTVTDATATSVQIKDGSTVLGNATVSNGVWSYTSGSLATGSHSFSAVATDLAGNTSTTPDAAFTIAASGLKIVYNAGVDTSTTTRTVSSTTPVVINTTGADTITLAIAEDAYLGDAEFTVSVDGVQIGGIHTATALHSAGLSQNFTLQGNFGAGVHTVAVDFLNDAVAVYSNNTIAGDRNLYVDAITGDGVTTVFNNNQNLNGSTSYQITLPKTSTVVTAKAPVVTLAAAPSVATGSPATLGTAVAGNSGDVLTVKLVSDSDFATGSSLVLSNGSLIYTAGAIAAVNAVVASSKASLVGAASTTPAGSDTITYTVTDSTNKLVTTETQTVTLLAPVVVTPPAVAPVVSLAVAPRAAAGISATLGTAVAGNSGDALTVKLVSDPDFGGGSSLTLNNGSLVYTAGTITAANAGSDTITYTVTDSTNKLVTTETQTVTLVAPVVVAPPAVAPVVTLAAAPSAAAGISATLGTAVAGNSGDALTVKLISDPDFGSGSSLKLSNGSLIYTAGAITAANAGSDTLSYTVTDSNNNLVTTETQTVTLVAPVVVTPPAVAPLVTLAASPSAAAGVSATLGTAVAGNSGDALTVKLVSDPDFGGGSSLTLSNGNLIYTAGTITAANAGTDTISYTVTDSSNNLVTTETQKVTLVAPVVVTPPDRHPPRW